MIYAYLLFCIAFNLLHDSQSLQTGYTCQSSVKLTCPKANLIIVLQATYSTECKDKSNMTSMYPPSRCIGHYRERISTQCNGKETCTIDNSVEQRPSFSVGPEANCAFKGQSMNIEYLCIPDFESSNLLRIDICASQSIDGIKKGFIHTPNYPDNYQDGVTCTYKIPAPAAGHRLKIFVLDFDVESASLVRSTKSLRINDWLEINENGEKFYGKQEPFTSLFDDVIGASLTFKSDMTTSARSYHGFLLYFIEMPISRSRPPSTTTTSTDIPSNIIQEKAAGLIRGDRRKNNVGLILLVVLLTGILVIIITGLLLYKRRNDRRIRYLTETFSSFKSKGSKSVSRESSDYSNATKFDVLPTSNEEKLISQYSNEKFQNIGHIYSADPVEKKSFLTKDTDNSNVYECIDDDIINQQKNDYIKPNENIV